LSSSSTHSTSSVRGGSSGATSTFLRRRTNGLIRVRSRVSAALSPSMIGCSQRTAKSRRAPSRPGAMNWNWLHSSSRRFSTGVPVKVSLKAASSRHAARVTWLSGFLMACASSSTIMSQRSAASSSASIRKIA
jgi:hypothetical protein